MEIIGLIVAGIIIGLLLVGFTTWRLVADPRRQGRWSLRLATGLVMVVALLGPAVVGIGLKIQSLVESGEIAQDGATGAAAVLGGFGALFATIANVVVGRLSDRTTSRFGRRRPWIIGCLVPALLAMAACNGTAVFAQPAPSLAPDSASPSIIAASMSSSLGYSCSARS